MCHYFGGGPGDICAMRRWFNSCAAFWPDIFNLIWNAATSMSRARSRPGRTGMTPCGYTILLLAWDRALVDGSCSGHWNEMGVGFCLRAKQKN